ncbi:hypothetical protein K3495_g10000 [Podosphaera aphanis]|nr:hypothetical protein K3495_g10000 [Podosphaera aphanis]
MNISQATTTPIRYSDRFSREQRIRVLALYEARHSNREISDLLGISMNQVKYTIQTGRISPGKSTGRPHKLSTEQENELEVFVCRDKETRQMSYLELSIHFHMWNVGQDAIRNALRRRGYLRYITRSKPPLTEQHKLLRIEWAHRHFHFTLEDWCYVVWTDETYLSDSPQILMFKWQTKNTIAHASSNGEGRIIPGCSGVVLQGLGQAHMFFGRDWGKMTRESYRQRILPDALGFIGSLPTNNGLAILMHDKASVHTAAPAREYLEANGVVPMAWPPFSPDLNPIENELIEIIRSFQRQERAWHIRLSICSGLICNIDSTLSSYKVEFEKEEAETIRSYLHQAIARLAASEKVPLPPPIPTQLKPPRATKNTGSKETVTRNPVLVDTPRIIPVRGPINTTSKPGPDKQPISIPPTENTWAKVAHNGYKRAKATAVLQTLPSSSPTSWARSQPSSSMLPTNSNVSRRKLNGKIDSRLFIRLPINHDWRRLSLTGLRNVIIKRMSVSTTTIGLIKPVRSGFALSPNSVQAREELLKAFGGLFLLGATLEPDTIWVGILVPTVPRVIYTLKDRLEVTGALLADEIELIFYTSRRRQTIRVSKNNMPQFTKVVAQWIPPVPSLNTIEEVEDFAHDLTRTLTDALRAVECKEAHREYRAAVLESERTTLGKAFRHVVAKAKHEYWKKRIGSMHTLSDVLNLMGWLTPRLEKISPPLFHNEKFISDQAERATDLRDNLLARHQATDSLPNFTISNEGHIPWTYDLTESEVQTCTIGSGNTCPRADGISVELLATCWDCI